jgi:hypothetical protein
VFPPPRDAQIERKEGAKELFEGISMSWRLSEQVQRFLDDIAPENAGCPMSEDHLKSMPEARKANNNQLCVVLGKSGQQKS